MRGRRRIAALVAASSLILLGTAGAASNVTFIYAGAADPTYLDPALVSDGESFRIARQIFDTLVQLAPGTTKLQPALATSWTPEPDGKIWTFKLRRGVKFHDGTAFNSAAVCANFNRWYNWTGPFQDASASYYYRQLFGGFKKNESTGVGPPLYRSCRGSRPVRRDHHAEPAVGPFVPSLVLPAFAMQSPTAMPRYDANKGQLVSGTFRPTGTYAFSHPTGTGPWKFESWTIGQRVVLVRNNSYWGKRPQLARIIVRPISNNTARLQALQTGEINGYDLVAPQDMPTIRNNSSLRLINRPPFNVAYVTINRSKPPMNNVRCAAGGRPRPRPRRRREVVLRRPGASSRTASCRRRSRGTSRTSGSTRSTRSGRSSCCGRRGLSLPVKIDFYWPTNVSRPYMPSPNLNLPGVQGEPGASGFDVNGVSEPWRPDYVKHVNEGTGGHLNIIGWTGDYADADNFLGTFFQSANPQFGLTRRGAHGVIAKLLDRAEAEVNAAKRVKLYKQINKLDRGLRPGRAVRPLDAGRGVFSGSVRLQGQPCRDRVVLRGHDRGTVGASELSRRTTDAAFRRPPAPAPRPDPDRAVDPRLRLGPGPAGEPGRLPPRRAHDARSSSRSTRSASGSTSRSTSSTGSTSRRPRSSTSASARRHTATSPTRSRSASRRRSSSRSQRCSSRSGSASRSASSRPSGTAGSSISRACSYR